MTVNEALRGAILPLVPVCEPDRYDGDAKEYCTFVYDDQPEVFAEGRPHCIRQLVVLNWYAPRDMDPLQKKRQICRALKNAGFTWPYVQNATDGAGYANPFTQASTNTLVQHFIFECEWADGDV